MRSEILFYTPPGTLVDPLGGWSASSALYPSMPLCTKLSFLSWVPSHFKFRIAECAVARASAYYFAQAGSDSGSGTPAVPWKSLAKAQAVLDATASGDVAFYFAEGDVWRETPTLNTLSPTITQGSTAVISGTPPVNPRLGMTVTLQNSTTGARQYATVTAYNSTSKMVTVQETIVGTYDRLAVNQVLFIDKPNVTVSTYRASGSTTSPGSKAHFTAFQTPYNTSWTSSSTGVTYFRNDSSALTGFGWIRPTFDTGTFPLRLVGSPTLCAQVSGSWCASGTLIFVNDWNGAVLNSGDRTFEAVYKNYYEGIVIRDVDNIYIKNIMLSGYGAGAPGDISYPGYAIHLFHNGSARAVIHNCGAFFNGRHSITHTATSSGGIFTCVGCRVGWLVNDGIPIIGYSGQGRNQMYLAYNTFVGSTAPSGTSPYGYGTSGNGYYSHTGAASSDLLIAYKNQFLPGPFMAWGGSYGNPAAWSDLANCKSFIIGETWPDRLRSELDSLYPTGKSGQMIAEPLPVALVPIINCDIYCNTLDTPSHGDFALWRSYQCFFINSNIVLNYEGRKGHMWSAPVRSLSSAGVFGASWDYSKFYYSTILFRVPEVNDGVGMINRLINVNDGTRNNAGTGNATGSGKIYACVIGLDNDGFAPNFMVGWNNNATNLRGNAYLRPWYNDKSSTYSGYSNDPDYVELSHYAPGRQLTSQLSLASPITVEGYTLEYDKDGVPRNTITHRGPWEGLP